MTGSEQIVDGFVRGLRAVGIEVEPGEVVLERPPRPEHGDLSSNVALVVAGRAGRAPRAIAEELADRLTAFDLPHVEAVDVAGPGFVNLHLRPSYFHEALAAVLVAGPDDYARPDIGRGERVQIEFVSANPTGPLHVGNGWFASFGDALARLLERCGYTVEREYYLNDTGNQIRLLGESLLARRAGTAPPEEGYQGAYLVELAASYNGPDDATAAGRFASDAVVENIRATLARLGVVYDRWFSQASIEEGGQVEETIEILRAKGLVYEKDGATWFASREHGDSRDRVLVTSAGELTYLAGDIAYHRDKFLVRGFDRVIDVFGADHHGQVPSLRAAVAALGIDPGRLEVELGQLVSLVSGRMSKRSGQYVRLDELIDILGPDATRLLALMGSINQATTIDLDAVRRQSMENPVYYVQYAHARIASIERVAAERGVTALSPGETDLSVLVDPHELELIRRLIDLPEVLAAAAAGRVPYKVTNWVRQLAADFHGFYHGCRVLGDEVPLPLTQARLALVAAVRIGLAIGLGVLGVAAPESM
ncbi:MAG: arginine--tRNA ligase [Acidimicrobiales bacterium]